MIIANVLEATAPTSEINRSMRGTIMASANVNKTMPVLNKLSNKPIRLTRKLIHFLLVGVVVVPVVDSPSSFRACRGLASFKA